MSTLTELGDFLEAHLVGLTQGESLFLGIRPDAPDVCLTIYQYPGGEPEAVQERSVNVERTQVQIIARGSEKGYSAADRMCAQAWSALASVRNATLSGTKYRSITPTGRGSLGTDTNDRPLIGFNASVEKEVSFVA